jgi:hypothetical protein
MGQSADISSLVLEGLSPSFNLRNANANLESDHMMSANESSSENYEVSSRTSMEKLGHSDKVDISP